MGRRVDLIGLPTDVHSSYLRGPAKAPSLIRAALFSPHGNAASERGLEIGAGIEIADLGDLPLREAAEDDAMIREAIASSLRAGAVPIALGGDHAVTFPILQAIEARHGPVDILHFDAHPDLYDELDGDRRSHASPFARIMEAGLASSLTQVGIRTLNAHQREQAKRFGVTQIQMRDLAAWRPRFENGLYISVDMDGFDPAYAPGVSHHEPGGLTARYVIDLLLSLDAPLLGGDVVEYNPDRDINGVTAVLAAKVVKELAALASV
ncbi:MAG: arginase family protein [Hyphomonadaceae bacterium]|nr:arginase family protein [Hyphomonadaceae bacterium]